MKKFKGEKHYITSTVIGRTTVMGTSFLFSTTFFLSLTNFTLTRSHASNPEIRKTFIKAIINKKET